LTLPPGCLIGQQPCRFDLGGHIGNLEGDRLLLSDRLAELLALFRIGDRGIQRPLGNPDGLGRNAVSSSL
jgi:hypothetical protein